MTERLAFLAALTLALAPCGARPQSSYPVLVGELELAVRFDHIYDAATGQRAHLSDLYPDSEIGLALHVTDWASLQATLVIEPLTDASSNRAFEDVGLYAEQLFVNFELGRFAVYAGKFNPAFGTAWDRAPGIYGTDFAEDYEVTEQIGLGAAAKLETLEWGAHELNVAAFFADTSFLSNSAITRPRRDDPDLGRAKRLRLADGGAGNTESLQSFLLALNGGSFGFAPNLGYHVSLLRREPGRAEIARETGVAAGLQAELTLGPGANLTPLVEVARFFHFAGQAQDADYVTVGAEIGWQSWSLAFSTTARYFSEPEDGSGPNGRNARDHLRAISLGHDLGHGLGVAVGLKNERLNGQDVNTVGFVVSYDYDFQLGGRR
ncbi:MAG: hypothetical protein FJX68_10265 [Alphaproteobacteria bacterium]|nr:hypothetical protein [Alphaproteobacteria bacterium]